MNAQNTNSVPKTQTRRTEPPVAAGQWWKAWVLLTGLGVTVIGWMALPRDEPPPVNGIISSQVSMSAENSPVVRVERIHPTAESIHRHWHIAGKAREAAFQAPITRTRRS